MAISSSNTELDNRRSPPRSVRFSLESNPVVTRISKELEKIRRREESSSSAAETIAIGLCGVGDLYKCIGADLTSPLTQKALSLSEPNRDCILNRLLHGSEKLLEACEASRQIAVRMKDASADLRSSLLQTKQCSAAGAGGDQSRLLSSYICSRKTVAKSAKQLLRSIKRMQIRDSFVDPDHQEEDTRQSAMMNMLTCVSIIHASILESLLDFLAMPVVISKRRSATGRKFGLISRLIVGTSKTKSSEGRIELSDGDDDEEKRNELKDVDLAISALFSGDEGVVVGEEKDKVRVRLVGKRLQSCEVGIQGIESGLEFVNRQLTQARATLLKILTL